MKKVISIAILLIIIATASFAYVKATSYSQQWTTTFSISSGSSLNGTKRSHYYNNQSISFTWTTIGYIGAGSTPYFTMTLYKKGTLSYSAKNTMKVYVSTGTASTSVAYPDTGSGKYYFGFSTGTASNPTGYFKADPVIIRSYE